MLAGRRRLVLLKADPALYNAMHPGWQSWFSSWMEFCGLELNRIMYTEYSPETGILRVEYLKLNPMGTPYVDPKNKDQPAFDLLLYFFDKTPARINIWEWEKMMPSFFPDSETS